MIPYATIISYAVLAAASAWGGWAVQGWRLSSQLADLKTEYLKRDFVALEKAHADTVRLQEQAARAARKAAARQAALADAAARVRTERDGLRDELAASRAAMPDASCTSIREHAATLNTVFGLCADRLEGLASKAQGHASDTLKLSDEWPSNRSSTIESER